MQTQALTQQISILQQDAVTFKASRAQAQNDQDKAKAESARTIASLQDQLTQSQSVIQQKIAELDAWQQKVSADDAELKRTQKQLDDAKTQISALTKKPEPPPIPVAPVIKPSAVAAINKCTQAAGHPFDPDNKDQGGMANMKDMSSADLQAAVDDCTEAVSKARDAVTKRRMLAQLGRAYASLAVQINKDGDSRRAQDNMKAAVASLTKAQEAGSGFAMSLLGSYYNGIFNDKLNTFVERQPEEAAYWFKKGAEAGNPIAMANFAAIHLDGTSHLPFDVSEILEWLGKAENQKYPQAFTIHAGAMLDERFTKGLSRDDRRRNAEALGNKAGCLDPTEADNFFRRNSALRKPSSYSCG
jgi:TPR repeat protein